MQGARSRTGDTTRSTKGVQYLFLVIPLLWLKGEAIDINLASTQQRRNTFCVSHYFSTRAKIGAQYLFLAIPLLAERQGYCCQSRDS